MPHQEPSDLPPQTMQTTCDEQALLLDLTFVPFDPSNPTASHRALAPSAKRLVTEEGKANIRAVRAKGSCLRCKILKKQCDEGEPCKQCPKQNVHATSDHWKVLGCLRDLTSLGQLDVLRQLDRTDREVLFCDGQREILHWSYLDPSYTGAIERQNEAKLDRMNDVFRRGTSHPIWSRDGPNLEDPSKCCEPDVAFAAFSVWGGLSTNFSFDNIVELAEKFLVASHVSYMTERDWQFYYNTNRLFHPFCPQEVRLFTLSHHLQAYLSAFQERCSKRGKSTPEVWAATLYSLCILNDALRTLERAILFNLTSQPPTGRSTNYLNQLRAIYASLVKTFCWAQGPFDLLGETSSAGQHEIPPVVLYDLKTMTEHKEWGLLGIKSTKMFLDALGHVYGSAWEKVRLFFVRKCFYCANPTHFPQHLWTSPCRFTVAPTTVETNLEYQFYPICRGAAVSLEPTTAESSTIYPLHTENIDNEHLLHEYKRQARETLSILDSLMEGRVSPREYEEKLSEIQLKKNALSDWGCIATHFRESLPFDRASNHSLSVFSFKTPSSHTSSLQRLRNIPIEKYGCCGASFTTVQHLIDHYTQSHSKPTGSGDLTMAQSLVDEQCKEIESNLLAASSL